ncbi:hypothetical protein TNIN_217451 [Trichonephila inaurata madagascariensis]|uniref:Uncharacterized protein n=1 Tax=Trichonephila inaurata madagascariensis TaxID=2747483 RepID=A0A8X7CCC1_9ARAC|nr:hypothetical protein TNIN_217451 [Trichonephila inaurata madagascariensis]
MNRIGDGPMIRPRGINLRPGRISLFNGRHSIVRTNNSRSDSKWKAWWPLFNQSCDRRPSVGGTDRDKYGTRLVGGALLYAEAGSSKHRDQEKENNKKNKNSYFRTKSLLKKCYIKSDIKKRKE